jgi:hypothetical protein
MSLHHFQESLKAAVEIDRRQQCLVGVSKKGGFMTSAASLLTPPKVQGLTQVELLRQKGELFLIDKLSPETGEFTLVVNGKTVNEQVTHGEIESCIAEELQSLVVRYPELRILVDVGPVKEGMKEELPIMEAVEESTFELLEQGVGVGRSRVQRARQGP